VESIRILHNNQLLSNSNYIIDPPYTGRTPYNFGITVQFPTSNVETGNDITYVATKKEMFQNIVSYFTGEPMTFGDMSRTNINLLSVISQLSQKTDSLGKEIIKETSLILAETMTEYLDKQILSLEKIHFYFNNSWIHNQDRVYLVCKTLEPDHYEIIKLNLKSTSNLGYSVSVMKTIKLPNLKENKFKDRLLKEMPLLKDFDPDKNVMVIGGGLNIDPINRIYLAKDTILLNRIMNQLHGFDANALLDFHRLLEKQKSIPFKLKV